MMKIIKRHNYKLEYDQLIMVGITEEYANIICKYLNTIKEENPELKNYYFQIVSDNFEIK